MTAINGDNCSNDGFFFTEDFMLRLNVAKAVNQIYCRKLRAKHSKLAPSKKVLRLENGLKPRKLIML